MPLGQGTLYPLMPQLLAETWCVPGAPWWELLATLKWAGVSWPQAVISSRKNYGSSWGAHMRSACSRTPPVCQPLQLAIGRCTWAALAGMINAICRIHYPIDTGWPALHRLLYGGPPFDALPMDEPQAYHCIYVTLGAVQGFSPACNAGNNVQVPTIYTNMLCPIFPYAGVKETLC